MIPTPEQVTRFASELHTKFDKVPGMKARIDRGAALALAGDVCPDHNGYIVLSSANDGTGYPIAPGGRCCCPDSAHGAPVVRGVATCKHAIAYNIFHRALAEALAARILGDSGYGNRQQQRQQTNTWLLLRTYRDGTTLWSDRVGRLGRVTWLSYYNAWIPATPADLIAVEEWLDQAHELPGNALADTAALEALGKMEAMDADAVFMDFGEWIDIYRPALTH